MCGRSRGFGRGGCRTRGGEPDRGLKTKRAVRPPVVVVFLRGRRDRPGVVESVKDLLGEALVTESAVEALGEAVLPGATGLDGERQDADAIEDEIPAPDVVWILSPSSMAAIGTHAQKTSFSLLLRHCQPLSLPESEHAGQPRSPSFEDEQASDPSIAEPRPSTSQLKHSLHKRYLVGSRLRLDACCFAAGRLLCRPFARRSRTSFEARSPPLASGKGLPVSLREMLTSLVVEGEVGHDLF